LSLPASQLENSAGGQQHHQSTNEKYGHGRSFARGILQFSLFRFGVDG
jgi:hypothetical protein